MTTQVGQCPHCGAPIYIPTVWWGINPPPHEYTCSCAGINIRVITITNTTGTTPPTLQEGDKQTDV